MSINGVVAPIARVLPPSIGKHTRHVSPSRSILGLEDDHEGLKADLDLKETFWSRLFGWLLTLMDSPNGAHDLGSISMNNRALLNASRGRDDYYND